MQSGSRGLVSTTCASMTCRYKCPPTIKFWERQNWTWFFERSPISNIISLRFIKPVSTLLTGFVSKENCDKTYYHIIPANRNLNYSLTSAYIFISTILPHFTALILRYSVESPTDSFGLEYIDKCVRLRISYCCYNLVDLITRNY